MGCIPFFLIRRAAETSLLKFEYFSNSNRLMHYIATDCIYNIERTLYYYYARVIDVELILTGVAVISLAATYGLYRRAHKNITPIHTAV